MQYKSTVSTVIALCYAALSSAAYVPSEPWSTLTPSGSIPSGAVTDYATSFAIAISPITTTSSGIPTSAVASVSSSVAVLNKRDVVSQIGDGQIQATTGTESTTSTAATTTAQVVSQIGDGQIQATTSTGTTSTAAQTTAQVVSQIGDGQIQATTSTGTTATTAQVVSQIGDGQIQATTSTGTTATATAVSQISDGQIQATTEATTATTDAASQISDGQVQATGTSSSDDSATFDTEVACNSEGTLAMTLNSSILIDSDERIGSIVANHQFQFDATPQAGALYAAGWSITEDGYLSIGDSDVFYQCLSGTFYNLYDESIGDQCTAVRLTVVELIDC